MDFDKRIDFRDIKFNTIHKDSIEYWLLMDLMTDADIYPESYDDDDIADSSIWDNYRLFHSNHGVYVNYNRSSDTFIIETSDWCHDEGETDCDPIF